MTTMRAQLSLLTISFLVGMSACTPASSPGGNNGGTGASGGSAGSGSGGRGGSSGTGGSATSGGSGGSTSPGSGGSGGSTAAGGSGGAGGSTGSGGSGGSGAGGSGGAGGAGGGSADGGSQDAKPADSGSPTDGGGSETPAAPGGLCAGAKKCFDFEDQMPGQQPSSPEYRVELAGGTVTTDTTKFFSGKQSILIKTRGGTNFPGNNLVFSGIEKLLPENDLHGRVMMWMANTPGAAHWDSILGSAAGGSNPTYILGGMYRNFMSVYHPGDLSVDSLTPFPTGKWACIQWQFSGKGGMNLHKMMLDGVVVDKGTTTRWRAPTFSQLKVGYRHFNTNVAVDVWLDDLAFGDQPIACPQMK
jgi:hypothetical protein